MAGKMFQTKITQDKINQGFLKGQLTSTFDLNIDLFKLPGYILERCLLLLSNGLQGKLQYSQRK